jgi:hypothetical protein
MSFYEYTVDSVNAGHDAMCNEIDFISSELECKKAEIIALNDEIRVLKKYCLSLGGILDD